MNKIKVVQYGCGKMSVYTMRYAIEQGMEVVGAIDINPDVIGKDIGEIIGDNNNYGVSVVSVNDAEDLLRSTNPDICIITTMSLMNDIKDAMLLCANLGINAITTCEEAFYPSNSIPELTSEIDRIARENNCTITGSGYQDAFWGNLITTIAGATHNITKIKGSSSYNVEDYGIALAKAHGAGLTLEEFERDIASVDNISDEERNELINKGEYAPSYMWNVNGWLCDKLGLHVVSQRQKCVPQTYSSDIESSTLGMTVRAGMATGMSAVVTTTTEEGIILETECIGKVYGPDEFDSNRWTVYGEPNTELVIDKPQTVELTCATIVNRIPDVLKSEAGFVPTSRMGELKYNFKK
jgi:4-hydroxy-tetrahydrodipicolinate reductase